MPFEHRSCGWVARSRRGGRGIALEASNAGHIDAVKDHGELGGGPFDPGGRGFGEMISPGFQSLAPETQTVAAPVQDLDPVGRSIGENKQVAAQRISGKLGPNQLRQAVESQAQVHGGRETELGGGRDGQHGRSSNPRRTATRSFGRVSAGNRSTVPGGRVSSMGIAGVGGGVTRMGTMVGAIAVAATDCAKRRRHR